LQSTDEKVKSQAIQDYNKYARQLKDLTQKHYVGLDTTTIVTRRNNLPITYKDTGKTTSISSQPVKN